MTAVISYATLITRLGEDCNRVGDTDFASAAPGFIQSAEAEMNRRLRVRDMIARATATIDNEYELVPTGFMGVRSFVLQSSPSYPLEYLTEDLLAAKKYSYTTAGKPIFYAVVGGEFQFVPEPGDSYTASLSFWQKIPALSVSNTSNWLLESHPDAYVEGAKVHAFNWLQDEAREQIALQKFGIILADIVSDDASQSYGASMQTQSGIAV